MAVIKELIRKEADHGLSFGDYTLDKKTKLDNFEHQGDLYKVKTFKEITKLEKNGMLIYESVPGTVVTNLKATEKGMEFCVEGYEDAQITVELAADTEYLVYVDGVNVGSMKTNLGGKLSVSVELDKDKAIPVKIVEK
ncbi:MAG: endosialidase [Lachnospiraceae bacterium]|nr:endosialidase [Lachnospiraceae bacterium]